jgi:hypothetical protein
MASELLIRPGLNDHHVIADLVAPGGAAVALPAGRPLISRLVIDAHVVAQRPDFAAVAAASGTPLLIDPVTFLWQGELRPEDRWVKLPFGQAEKLDPADLSNPFRRDAMVAAVVEFQLAEGASAVVPPYTYGSGPSDPWFTVSLELLRATARYMHRNGIRLPVVPVLAAQLQTFGDPRNRRFGVDRFIAAAIDVGPQALAYCMSPSGAGSDSYAKILRLFEVGDRLQRIGAPTLVWRQGVFGPALVAAGAAGYETGIATRETCSFARSIASRKPPRPGATRRSGGAALGIYIDPLRRSVPAKVGLALLGDRGMRPRVMCDDERCCPNGVSDTIDKRREHAIRARAKDLAALDAQPHESWRLHQIAKDAQAAADLTQHINRFLGESKIAPPINSRAMEELARVAEHMREARRTRDAA